jgi:hypothetical protein
MEIHVVNLGANRGRGESYYLRGCDIIDANRWLGKELVVD